MAGTFTISIPIPDGKGRDLSNQPATWRVETMPDRKIVIKNMEAKGSITVAADPGKYVWACKNIAKNEIKRKHLRFKFSGYVLHEVTEDQWQVLSDIRPMVARAMHTMRGVVWHCGFVGCDEEHTSRLSSAVHEAKHQGIDLLKDPNKVSQATQAVEKAIKAQDMDDDESTRPRRRGRPPKNA